MVHLLQHFIVRQRTEPIYIEGVERKCLPHFSTLFTTSEGTSLADDAQRYIGCILL